MGVFDLEKAAKVLGSPGGSLLDAVGTGFGAPQCIMNMTEDILSLLPSNVLSSFSKQLQDARDAANNATALITKKLFIDTGIIEFSTDAGRWKFVGDSSKYGLDLGDSGLLEDVAGLMAVLKSVTTASTMYVNVQTAANQIEDLKECLDKFSKILAANKGSGALAANLGMGLPGVCQGADGSTAMECEANGGVWVPEEPPGQCYGADGIDEATCIANGGAWVPGGIVEPPGGVGSFGPKGPDPETQFALQKAEAQAALDFAGKCNSQLSLIGNIMRARALDPDKEPIIDLDNVNPALLAGTKLRRATKDDYNNLLNGSLSLDDNGNFTESKDKIFRLEYGPPRAKKGQFLLTIDGLYYDSQSGGLPDMAQFTLPPAGERYLNKYAPNLGGKGTPIGDKELDIFMDTLFDPSKISESEELQSYYNGDHFLQQLIGEKSKHINDLHKKTEKAIADGSGTSVVYNMRQAIVSNTAKHDAKINKRKKQIELAVVTPGTFGSEATQPKVGEIPINDFTYLKDYNVRVSLEAQKGLTFKQAEVSGVVLPIQPLYVEARGSEPSFTSNHLMIPTIGTAGIIFDSSSGGSRDITLLNLTDEIVTDNLISVYNFQEATVELPTVDGPFGVSSKWGVLNCAASGIQNPDQNNPIITNNAKFISESTSTVFASGLTIPKFTGLIKYNSAGNTASVGSAVRLPSSKDFDDLFFNKKGATIESWVYIPGIETSSVNYDNPDGSWGPYLYNRLMLGCENNGGLNQELTDGKPENTFGSDHVRGFVMGFSRDRRVVSDLDPSNNADDNPTENMCFFAAPTISYNSSSIGFITKEESICAETSDMFKFKVDLDTLGSHGKRFSDVSGNFMHIAYVVDPSSNSMSVYLDGIKMATSSIDLAFGLQNPNSYLALPTWCYKETIEDTSYPSFEYNLTSTSGIEGFQYGPKLNQNTTPWILGGGYSDGFLRWEHSGDGSNPQMSGFMGEYHGRVSGLNGYMGSVKFYSKALSDKEVLKNYKAQAPYFKNIEL